MANHQQGVGFKFVGVVINQRMLRSLAYGLGSAASVIGPYALSEEWITASMESTDAHMCSFTDAAASHASKLVALLREDINNTGCSFNLTVP
eukprot:SAG11_NODE_1293_length_5284_cov_2.541562_4_plen_92_part_00